jgi:hypothetical protein
MDAKQQQQQQQQQQTNPCQAQADLFIACMKTPSITKNKDKQKCKPYFDTYTKCINMLE